MTQAPQAPGVREFHKGQTIFKEGQVADCAYLIKTGMVTIYKVIDNKRIVLEQLGPGRLFGEMGVISNYPRAASAEAEEFSQLAVVDRALLADALAKSPRIVQIMNEMFIERLRATTAKLGGQPLPNLLLAVARFLEMKARAMAPAQSVRLGGKAPQAASLSRADLSQMIKDVMGVSQLEIDEQFKKLFKMGVVQLEVAKPGTHLRDPQVRVPDVEALAKAATSVHNLWQEQSQVDMPEAEFLDFHDYAKLVDTQPEMLAKKVGAGEVPLNLLFLHRSASMNFAREMGPDFFKSTRKPTSRLAELASVEDLAGVDDATLQEVFTRLGHYKLGVLLAMASPEAREGLAKHLSSRARGMAENEVPDISRVSPSEASDVEFEAVTMVKKIKGLPT